MSRMWDDLPRCESDRLRFGRAANGPHRPLTAFGAPDGHYSRVCWLPVLGPTAWVLWGTVARDLDAEATTVVHDIDDLTEALGLGRPHRLLKALKRLDRLGVASSPTGDLDNRWRLPTIAPPLWVRHHASVSARARRAHHRAIDALTADEQHVLWEIHTETYLDHFGGHPR